MGFLWWVRQNLFLILIFLFTSTFSRSQKGPDTHYPEACLASSSCYVPSCWFVVALKWATLEGAVPHAPLGQTEGSVSFSLKQLYFSNVPSPNTDVISFSESFQLDSKQSFIALWKSFEMTNYFYIQSAVFSFSLFLHGWKPLYALFCVLFGQGSYLKYSWYNS